MRYLYSLLFYLALPFIFLRVWWRGKRQPAYRARLLERLGYYPLKKPHCIWIHAVSVGETLAALPLIKALKTQYVALPIIITTMTPTGAQQVKNALGESVVHVYLPYDFPGAVKRFLNSFKPLVGLIMETELWPNLLAACKKREIPISLLNARLSLQSAQGYRRIGGLTREMLASLSLIAANGQRDAALFLTLGADQKKVVVTGNLKFDLDLPLDLLENSRRLRNELGVNKFIWIAASTHAGEEEILLTAQQKLRQINPNALLILVPRHPDRFEAIASLCAQVFTTQRRSKKETCTPTTAIYLGDTMGELLMMYGAADVAFIGGSLVTQGGHNMLEPGALSKPILTGPHLANFQEISDLFIAANALVKVTDAETLAAQLIHLMQNPVLRAQMGANAKEVVARNRGALAKQLALVTPLINDRVSALQIANP